jgi:hypothetical protein
MMRWPYSPPAANTHSAPDTGRVFITEVPEESHVVVIGEFCCCLSSNDFSNSAYDLV